MKSLYKKSRRTFIKNATILAAAIPSLSIMEKEKQQIVHHVFFG
ncbi:twin-arginine translocation signal domain-containing protein [Niabella ginsengisoli]|uniref:Twin-arginine translocation signal domain-containing protein n=1 Tax=Niabella ginsengisoli TaxID=522298 RepID=A0ABS9SHP3_9BACT|nr:twin-arginine translocation signal domain-containing protein [Niabella ginsengisoli]MCH5597882.1 twin-arginine translocation signal domain-containing protein [Niabella ginsengisoli]